MGLMVNSNIPAIGAKRQTDQTTRALNNNLNKLASGLRINSAKDDAAGLAISERFRSQIRQYTVEVGNLQSGISAVQTAEGGLGVQQDAVQRIRELALQASNGTLSAADREALNQEAQQLVEQINSTAEGTEFNGTALLNSNGQPIPLGTAAGDQVTVNRSNAQTLGVQNVDLTSVQGATAAIGNADTAMQRIGENRASLGAQENRFSSGITQRELGTENMAASESALRDLDMARASIEQSRNQILLQGSLSALIQSNIVPQTAARLLGT